LYEKFGRAEKLLMRIRALKWQATTLASPPDGRGGGAAAAIVTDLQALEAAARDAKTEAAMGACEDRIQAIDERLAHVRAQSA
jgi:hypothetical protein